MTRKHKLTLSIFLASLAALVVFGAALARPSVERAPNGTYSFCSNVFHNGVKIARVCVSWNISKSGDQVRANTNGTRSVLFFKSGYTAVLGPQSCVPYQEWTDQVVCKSTTKFKQGIWPVGGIKQTCVFDSVSMVCGVRTVLAPEAK